MTRARSTLLAIALAATMGSLAHAQPQRAPLPKPAVKQIQPVATAPTRIVRHPESLQLKSRPITNRVVPRLDVSKLLQRRIAITPAPAGPPGKRALVVIMENGGLMNNVDPALRQALNVNIKTVTCGDWEFELKAGETVVDLIARLGTQLLGNAVCVNPANWTQTTFNPNTWLNEETDRALENAVKANNSLLNTQSHYDQVVVLEDADAIPAKVLTAIRQLAPTHVIDIHVLTHGGDEFFVGHNSAVFNEASFFSPLKADKDAGKLYLRAVYQMNCTSGTLKDNWTGVGAIVVNGTQQKYLNNMPHQYFHFLERWLNLQESMSTASQKSFDDAVVYTRPIYTLVGQGAKVDVSKLTTAGSNVNAKVNTSL